MTVYLTELRAADHARQHMVARCPYGVTLEQAAAPEFLWLTYTQYKFKRGTIIDLFANDDSWYMQLLVMRADEEVKCVFTRQLVYKDWRENPAVFADLSAATVEHMGQQALWAVLNNGIPVANKFDTEGEAYAWLSKKAGPVQFAKIAERLEAARHADAAKLVAAKAAKPSAAKPAA